MIFFIKGQVIKFFNLFKKPQVKVQVSHSKYKGNIVALRVLHWLRYLVHAFKVRKDYCSCPKVDRSTLFFWVSFRIIVARP